MKTWFLKFASNKTPDDIFNFVVSGQKTIETRPVNPKDHPNYTEVQVGDKLLFHSLDSSREIEKTVTFVHIYKSVQDMVSSEPIEKILPSIKTPQELLDIYEQVKQKWGAEYAKNLETHGIVAIGFN